MRVILQLHTVPHVPSQTAQRNGDPFTTSGERRVQQLQVCQWGVRCSLL